MKTRVGLFGYLGNMGSRYLSILKYLKIPYHEFEANDTYDMMALGECSHFIIATNTASHSYLIKLLAAYGKPILCEKPISLSSAEVKILLKIKGLKLQMVNNYDYALDLSSKTGVGQVLTTNTYYNYYNTGKDGLAHDCIQLFILNKPGNKLIINTESPVWHCEINGVYIRREYIDSSYLFMVNDFLNRNDDYSYKENYPVLLNAHEQVERIQKRIDDEGLTYIVLQGQEKPPVIKKTPAVKKSTRKKTK